MNSMQITLNLDELLFVRSAVEVALRKTDPKLCNIFWQDVNFPDLLRQLDIAINVLFEERRKKVK